MNSQEGEQRIGVRVVQISDDPSTPSFAYDEYEYEPRILDLTESGLAHIRIKPYRRVPVMLPLAIKVAQ